jgi:hypothetical protein
MNRKSHYLDMPISLKQEDVEPGSIERPRRLWWWIIGLTVLAVFLIGLGAPGWIR